MAECIALKSTDTVFLAKEIGFENISIDLMYDIPGQTLNSWETTLKEASLLPISHLSLYNLTIEPHTLFFKKEKLLRKSIPDEETSALMYKMAQERLIEKGLTNTKFLLLQSPYYSIHNTGYWKARPFIGFGPSAFSYFEGRRFRNRAHLGFYSKSLDENKDPIDFEEELSLQEKQKELLAIQIRLLEGVHLPSFEKTHGPLPQETHTTLQKAKKRRPF